MYTDEQWQQMCYQIEVLIYSLHNWTMTDSLLVDRLEVLAQDMVWNGFGLTETEFHLRGIVEAFYGD